MKHPIFVGALVAMLSSSAYADPTSPVEEIHFKFDSAVLPADAQARLRATVDFANAHSDTRIVLDAHCDPIGESPYNVGLAIRRAESVRGQLTAMGVREQQIVLAIYGKDGQPSVTYAEDRRVTVWSTREPLASVTRQTFEGRGTVVTWQINATPAPVASR